VFLVTQKLAEIVVSLLARPKLLRA